MPTSPPTQEQARQQWGACLAVGGVGRWGGGGWGIVIKSGRIDPMSERADRGTWARWFVRQEQRKAGFKTSQQR